jgi:hypothetical protein
VWTGSRTTSGTIYKEGVGYQDAANIVDSSGTIQFRLRTKKLYMQGIASEAIVRRVFVHKAAAGTGNYSTALTNFYDGVGSRETTRNISAVELGATSNDFSIGGQVFDVRVTFDTATYMPPINNITIQVDDASELEKTNRNTA